ncbi:NAD(P)H-binding protein [Porticoccaceae bacterium]|nr:NAD(P)H-binding protein [Porticoccaceae bacterium]MDA7696633.1 NAD(P)H-binding protein [Porticoccaceae bacterium]MDA7769377.1 NAD(P)H-binding protein [Porticoccaceae bacterium]MDA8599311.1 NAD(P)H-binding protein [Porticoccaceae bacterium]MDA9583154.1 NAD(P)H-binding protein [Porticoccaceae bacterium]
MKILLAGCGDIGQRVAARFADEHQCFGLRRNPEQLPVFINPLKADLTNSEELVGIFSQDFDVVIATLTPGARTEEAYQKAYVDTATALVSSINNAKYQPKIVIWISSTSVYGDSSNQWLEEESPVNPASFSARALKKAEDIMTAVSCDLTIVRFSGIYGPGRLALLNSVKNGIGSPAQPKQWSNRIHSDDCAGFLVHLVNRYLKGQKLEKLYLGTDCEPAAQHDMRKWLAGKLNVILTEEAKSSRAGTQRYTNKKLLQSGYQLQYPSYREGYVSVIKSLSDDTER